VSYLLLTYQLKVLSVAHIIKQNKKPYLAELLIRLERRKSDTKKGLLFVVCWGVAFVTPQSYFSPNKKPYLAELLISIWTTQ